MESLNILFAVQLIIFSAFISFVAKLFIHLLIEEKCK